MTLSRRTPLKRRKGLSRGKRKPRPMTAGAMVDLVQTVMLRDGRCIAADHDTALCDGPTDAAHIVPQRVLKAHYEGRELAGVLADARNVLALCRTHHTLFDTRFLDLPDDALPLGFGAFLREFGLDAWWEAQEARRA